MSNYSRLQHQQLKNKIVNRSDYKAMQNALKRLDRANAEYRLTPFDKRAIVSNLRLILAKSLPNVHHTDLSQRNTAHRVLNLQLNLPRFRFLSQLPKARTTLLRHLKGTGIQFEGLEQELTSSQVNSEYYRKPEWELEGGNACGNLLIWISAFIPGHIAGYTLRVPGGPHVGKTAIPCPLIATPANPNCFRRGYLTDQRGFDSSPTASARMRSIAEIQLVSPRLIRTEHQTSGTTEINKSTGAVTCTARANMSRCKFDKFSSSGVPYPAGDLLIKLALTAAASDPCVNLAADIDYLGNIEILCSPSRGVVEVGFNGKVDSFPSFEMYASLNGLTQPLFRLPPPRGNTVVNLLGGASTPVAGKVVFNCSLGRQRTSVQIRRTSELRPLTRAL